MTDQGPQPVRIALVGNPNSGKSTLFNQLTGLRQKTGNFPGVTVDAKEGKLTFPSGREAVLIDLPGTYSLHPTSSDEKIVASVLTNPADPHYPNALLYIADATDIEKHLLLYTQLLDLGLPLVMGLNMADTAEEKGIRIDVAKLTDYFKTPVVLLSARTGQNVDKLLAELEKNLSPASKTIQPPFYRLTDQEKQIAEAVRQNFGVDNAYRALLMAHHYRWLPFLNDATRETLATIVETKNFQSLRAQVDETLDRFDRFAPLVQEATQKPPAFPHTTTDRIDAVLTHRWWGLLFFFAVMLLVFQAIFDWSSYPMDWIEGGFAALDGWLKSVLPPIWATELLTDGILAGLSGILVFVPQIALLFLLVTILEEVGYMARVVFMFDKTMRRFGMNGRSVVSLISGSACAVPAIMSARTISNWQERLITIMVTPFISCSARIPVYLVLIGLAVPPIKIGIFGAPALVFGSMYALGVVAAFGTGWAMKKWLGTREPSYLALELPVYRLPHWKNVWLAVWEKTVAFISGAGKIILYVSVALWVLARFGPGDAIVRAETQAQQEAQVRQLNAQQTDDLVAQRHLEASYAGLIGKTIEPAVRPLGYDWKIGIALFTSFAAREVFTGTLAILYNLGSAEADINNRDENAAKAALRDKMRAATFSDSGQPVYTLATSLSLLVFYALAMQCFSTLAVVRRETGSWRWAVFQFLLMSGMAYAGAWMVFQIFK